MAITNTTAEPKEKNPFDAEFDHMAAQLNTTAPNKNSTSSKVASRPKDQQLTMSAADNMETSAASQSLQAMLAKARSNAQMSAEQSQVSPMMMAANN